ncbi:hypothetical protein ACOZ38_24095 [Sphaerisporangium viridialbum]
MAQRTIGVPFQNRPAVDIDGVIDGLRESGDLAGAAAVEQHRP